MPFFSIRSILAATDLREGSDDIVTCAAGLAEALAAELHVVHSLDPSGTTYQRFDPSPSENEAPEREDPRQRAEAALARQIKRTVPSARAAPRARVLNEPPTRALVEYAETAGCDLVVLGPHRGGGMGAHFLGTTADRVVRTADVPCLVVSGPFTLPIDRIGVPLDFSPAARGALDVALALGSALASSPSYSAAPELHVFHVGWPVDRMDDPEVTARLLLPRLEGEVREAGKRLDGEQAPNLDVAVDVAWEVSPVTGITDFARARELGLIVIGTQGSANLRRLLIGSVASGVARSAPCPVLLVPSSLTRRFLSGRDSWERQARLGRAVVAVDLTEPSFEAAAWAIDEFAAGADIVLLHVLEPAKRPSFLASPSGDDEWIATMRAGAEARIADFVCRVRNPVRTQIREGKVHEKICEVASETAADLLIVGDHARRESLSSWLGSTAEALLGTTPMPLLLAHHRPPSRPRSILAAVDDSDLALGVLVWARFFAERFPARVHAITALDLLHGGVPGEGRMEQDVATGRLWLRGRAREAGLDIDEKDLIAEVGRPADAIFAAVQRLGTELLVVGSRGAGSAERLLVGSVAAELLRGAPCPVFVVEHPEQTINRRLDF